MTTGKHHFVQRRHDGRWEVIAEGAERARFIFDTQAEAEAKARELNPISVLMYAGFDTRTKGGRESSERKKLEQRSMTMAARIFTSFDYDHDESLRNLLVGQSRHGDSPFEICDWSVKEQFTGDWKKKVRDRIRNCEPLKVTMKALMTQCRGSVAVVKGVNP
jgi:hypothetical protein